MADDPAQPPNDSVGHNALYLLVPLFAVTVVLYAARIYTRLGRKGKLTAADYAITIAMVMEGIVLAFVSAAVASGFGRHAAYLNPGNFEAVARDLFITYVLGVWASCAARASVALHLLEISASRSWQVVLWSVIASQLALGLATNITELVQCRPVEANWKYVEGAICFTPAQQVQYAYVFVATSMAADAAYAVLPMYMVWRLRRPFLEKLLISILMTLSVFALAAGAFKLYYISRLDYASPEILREAVTMYMWIRVEEAAIIIAACAPLLKVPVENALHRLGIPRFTHPLRDLDRIDTTDASSRYILSKDSSGRSLPAV